MKRMFYSYLFLLLSFSLSGNNPIELGAVKWIRDYDSAVNKAEKENKHIFILFQEVPGCATCRNYGNDVLNHPFIVEAIETYFIPLAIFNNKEGKDADVLKMYNEPSWNNPVARIVDKQGSDVQQRLAGKYNLLDVALYIKNALKNVEETVPEYFNLLIEQEELRKKGTSEAVLSMYCFWTGEKNIGKLKGVVSTEAGFMNGKEVVKVEYAPEVLTYKDLLLNAKASKCATHVFTSEEKEIEVAKQVVGNQISKVKNFTPDRTPKYYLSNSEFKYLPLTDLQSARINSDLGNAKAPEYLLSPRQLEILELYKNSKSKKWKNLINEDFVDSWWTIVKL